MKTFEAFTTSMIASLSPTERRILESRFAPQWAIVIVSPKAPEGPVAILRVRANAVLSMVSALTSSLRDGTVIEIQDGGELVEDGVLAFYVVGEEA